MYTVLVVLEELDQFQLVGQVLRQGFLQEWIQGLSLRMGHQDVDDEIPGAAVPYPRD